VTGAKIADGAVTGADIDPNRTPYSRVVARLRNGTVSHLLPAAPCTFTVKMEAVSCNSGSGVTVTISMVDVIGTK
jgi:hypothetical protein